MMSAAFVELNGLSGSIALPNNLIEKIKDKAQGEQIQVVFVDDTILDVLV